MESPDRAQRVMDLYLDASELAPAEQAAFLQARCAGDDALRDEIAALLRCRTEAPDFLAEPIFRVGAELLADAAAGSMRPGDRLGDCVVESLLGIGGMGEVYLARDTTLGRPVAVKLIQRGRGNDLLRHFRHERQVLAGLNHPHIARLYGGAVTPEGQAYLVMEYVEGERLDAYCQEHRLTLPERLALFRKVCAAVSHAHQNLIIHRDLKPANIRVTPEGEPKLLDFGIAKLLDPEDTGGRADPTLTLHGAMTPEYASPEQIKGEAITTASDVYSLGVVLHELLTGQRPFAAAGRRPDELARAICEEEPPRPSTVVRRADPAAAIVESPERLRRLLRGDLDNIVAKAMRKEPARRYASVAQLSDDLRRHCEGLPVSARRDTLGYRAGKFVQRNKVGVAAGVLVVLSLVGGLVATAWQTHVARRERDAARTSLRQAERLDDFLQNLLRSADPEKMGKDVKITQMLDAAGEGLDERLADEPEVLAKAHESLAYVYGRLWRLESGVRHIRAALDIRRRLGGEDDPATMRAELWLAGGLANEGKYLEAEPLLRQAMASRRRQSPPDAYWTARTAEVLGAILCQTGHSAEGETLLQEALATMRVARGDNSLETINIIYRLAWTRLSEGRLEAAEAGLRRAVELYDGRAAHSLDAIPARRSLAICLVEEQRMQEARQWLESAETDTVRLLGKDGVPYASVRLIRACADFVEGSYPAVIEELRGPLETIAAKSPNDHLSVVQARCVLGLALTRTGRAAEAEADLRKAYAEAKEVSDAALDLLVGNPATALGECLLAQARYAESEPLLLEGRDHLQRRLGPQHPMTIRAADQLRALAQAWRKPEAASR